MVLAAPADDGSQFAPKVVLQVALVEEEDGCRALVQRHVLRVAELLGFGPIY